LQNHALTGILRGKRALKAGYDLRLVFEEKDGYTEILFLQVGTHKKVYGA